MVVSKVQVVEGIVAELKKEEERLKGELSKLQRKEGEIQAELARIQAGIAALLGKAGITAKRGSGSRLRGGGKGGGENGGSGGLTTGEVTAFVEAILGDRAHSFDELKQAVGERVEKGRKLTGLALRLRSSLKDERFVEEDGKWRVVAGS